MIGEIFLVMSLVSTKGFSILLLGCSHVYLYRRVFACYPAGLIALCPDVELADDSFSSAAEDQAMVEEGKKV